MRIVGYFCAAVAAFVAGPAPAKNYQACDQRALVIEDVWLFGGKDHQSIAVKNGRIAWVGDLGAEPKEFRNARRMIGAGATALPGLIDSHTHFDALPAAKHLQAELDVRTEIYPITMRQTLASGVTTARAHLAALSDMAFLREIADDPCYPGPRIVLSGPGLLGGAPSVNSRLMRGFADSNDLADKIEQLVAHGAEWIALHAPAMFTESEKSVIRSAKETHNVQFLADGDSFENLAAALDLPITSAEYLNRSSAAEYPDSILSSINARPAALYIAAPLGYYRRSALFANESEKKIDDALLMFVPDEYADAMRNRLVGAFEEDPYIAKAVSSFPMMKTKFDQLRGAGALPVIGSDSGSLGQFHHDAVWVEFAAWAAFGIAPGDILGAATRRPAAMLGRSDIGVIEDGAYGDIVLIEGVFGEGNYRRDRVRAVVKGGVVYVENGEWRGPDADTMKKMRE